MIIRLMSPPRKKPERAISCNEYVAKFYNFHIRYPRFVSFISCLSSQASTVCVISHLAAAGKELPPVGFFEGEAVGPATGDSSLPFPGLFASRVLSLILYLVLGWVYLV
jgi:hypothetical protein